MRTEDGQIVSRCLNGEPEAFGFLVDRYRESVYAFVYSKLGNFLDAEDVTQEVFIKAFQKLRTLRRWDSFHAWIYSIANNLCKNWLRNLSKRPDGKYMEDQEPKILQKLSLDSYREESLYQIVHDALQSIPEAQRQILTMFYLGGMSTKEMARFLGTSPNAIAQRLYLARSRLKEEMLIMIKAVYEEKRLPIGFTLRIVETIKRIKIQPTPKTTTLPWGLSLVTGLIFTILSLNPNLFNPVNIIPDFAYFREARIEQIVEMPVKILDKSEMLFFSNQAQGGDNNEGNTESQKAAPAKTNTAVEIGFLGSFPEKILGLRQPGGIKMDKSGKVYVADGNNFIQVFDSEGKLIKNWGSYGSGDGEFRGVADIDLDFSGKIYVVEYENNRVQVFDSDGKFLKKWGTQGDGDGQFNSPRGLAVDNSGNVYVADNRNNRIQKFDSNGNFLMKWGISGTDDGQFNMPRDIIIDDSGVIYVADSGNNRIQKFDLNGNFLGKWGIKGNGDGQLSFIHCLSLDGFGNLYVVDDTQKIQKFDSKGNFLEKWNFSNNGAWDRAGGIAFDNAGNIYVTGVYSGLVYKFDSEGNVLKRWGETQTNGQLNTPYGVGVDSLDNIYVADTANYRVQKFDSRGKFLNKWGTYGWGDNQFPWPTSIAFDSSDNVYVCGWSTDRVQKFDSSGKFLKSWGGWGVGEGQFNSPKDVAVDKDDNVYVIDPYNNCIQKFDTKGNFLMKWGSQGSGDGQFNYPDGIAVDRSGNVYVADTYNYRIQKFNSKGKFLTKWGSQGSDNGQFDEPEDIALDKWGRVYVADFFNHRIQVFDSNGKFLTKWGAQGAGEMEFNRPAGVSVSNSGEVYVADSHNHRIKIFRISGSGAVEPVDKQMGMWGEVKKTALLQNFPNPFNPETWIPYFLGRDTRVNLKIYDSMGRLVRMLDIGHKPSGSYIDKEKAIYWDGRNDEGEQVTSGIYFYNLNAGDFSETRKMTILR